MDPISSRWRTFWALQDAMDANSHAPTVRELAQLVGLPFGTVHSHLKSLKNDRWIYWPHGKARSITTLRVPTAQPPTHPTSLANLAGQRRPRPPPIHVDLTEFAIAAGPPTAVQPIEDT